MNIETLLVFSVFVFMIILHYSIYKIFTLHKKVNSLENKIERLEVIADSLFILTGDKNDK